MKYESGSGWAKGGSCAHRWGEWQCDTFGPMAFKELPPGRLRARPVQKRTCLETAAQNGVVVGRSMGGGDIGNFPTTCAGMQTHRSSRTRRIRPPSVPRNGRRYVECVYAEILDEINNYQRLR